MKKVISLFLTAVMLMSLVATIPVTAEGENWAMYYDMAGQTPPTTWFEASYCYSENNGDGSEYPTYVQRVSDPTSPYYGAFDYTMIFDINLEDYGVADDHFSDLTFTHRSDQYHVGYSFSEKAFVVYRMYNPGNNPDSGYQLYASMSYELNKNEWYEMAIQWNGYVVRMYLNGVLMLEFDFRTLVVDYEQGTNDYRLYDIWQWESKAQPEKIPEDRLWLQAVDCSIYLDNFAFYSGDYDFGTGTATTTYSSDGDFVNAGSTTDGVRDEFSIFNRAPKFVKVPYGTEKVTYDRDFAANHTHDMVYDEANSSTVDCLTDGYDLWACSCGASEKRNFVAALGHLPGLTQSTIIAATETTSGVEVRLCNRTGCFTKYTTEVPLTGDGQALHHITDGGTSIYNGYMGVHAKGVMTQDDGITVSMDVMTVEHAEKGAAGVFAQIGGCDDHVWLGYSYYLGKFVATYDRNVHKITEEDIIAVSDKEYSDFTWNEWTWVRDGYYAYLYINGEKILEAYLGDYTYDLNGPNNDKDYTIDDTQFFLISTPCTELYIDNVIVASPDFDLEHKTGIVYEYSDFDDAGKDGAYNFALSDKGILGMFGYTKANKAGFELSSYGLPMDEITEVHRDMALKVDSDYDAKSNNTYSQLWANDSTGDDAINYNNDLVANDNALALDFEYSFDFYAYDWCTDPEKLGVGSAYIGGVINSRNDGFIGYDFLKQQAVIGSVGSQAGGAYGEDNVYANYTIEKDTWHNYKFKYYFDAAKGEYGSYILSIYIDGKEVLSYVIDTAFDSLDVEFYLMIPNFVKGYLDNLTIKIGDKYYDDGYDFNNGYGTDTDGFAFGGSGWSRVDGGTPVHVYEAVVYPASCVTDGYTVYNCACGNGGNYVAYDQIATGHSWNNGVVTTEPTVDAEGVMTYTCGICGETKTEAIEKLAPEYTPGDVNDDGRIQASDQSTFGRALSGASITINAKAADVNADGRVQANDLNMLARRLSGASIELG